MLNFLEAIMSLAFTYLLPLAMAGIGLFCFYGIMTVNRRATSFLEDTNLLGYYLVMLVLVFGYFKWLQEFMVQVAVDPVPDFSHGPAILAFFILTICWGFAHIMRAFMPWTVVGSIYAGVVVFGL